MNSTIRTTALLATLAAAIGVSAGAGAVELQPLQGYAIPLGNRTAAVYFRQEDGHKALVTTIAGADFQSEGSRQVTILESGATTTIPLTPSGILVLDATDQEATVALDVRVDLSAGKRRQDLAQAE